jgi:hypothetical protein
MLWKASIFGLFLNSAVDCAVGFICLDSQSTALLKVTQSSCIVIRIVAEYIYIPAVLAVYCIEGTVPSSWSFLDFCSQPIGPNNGLCYWSPNWRLFSMAMLTSTRQTKQKIFISHLHTSVHNLLYGDIS